MIGKWLRTALQAIGFIAILTLVGGAIALFLLGNWLQYESALEKADYIVPLAGDDNRLLKAAELYNQGLAPTILLSNAVVRVPSRVEEIEARLGYSRPQSNETRKRLLDYMGVPPVATAEFGTGHVSTAEEAEALGRFVGNREATIILVTSPSHTRRAKLTFESVAPKLRVLVASTAEGRLHNPWWANQGSARLVVSEITKLAYFWVGGRFRATDVAR